MAASKFVIFLIFISLVFTHTWADVSGVQGLEHIEVIGSEELDQLKSKIYVLEANVGEKSLELKRKDGIIAEKEQIIQDKLDIISSLQTEIGSLQKRGSLDAAEQVGKAHARAGELEKQVERLNWQVETHKKGKEVLQVRANEVEKEIKELGSKIENLQKVNNEQKTKISKTERALKVAEEEMLKLKFEITSKTKELKEAYGAWFPPWLVAHFIHVQSSVETHWNKHGKPTMDVVTQKAIEKKAQAENWAEPHIVTVKTKWIPLIKYQLLEVKTSIEPHMQSLKTKTIEVYETSKSTLAPHIVKVQEVADPYFQQTKKFSKPYIDQVVTMAKPHVDKINDILEPYSKKVVKAYGKFLESATTYHEQVQVTVKEMLKRHELTKPLATRELEWFTASALLALPIIIVFRILYSIFGKEEKKPARSANTNPAPRKHKRGQLDHK